jgi:hypothetical protein
LALDRPLSTLRTAANVQKGSAMKKMGRKSKHGGFVGNLAKLGGSGRKLHLAGDFRAEHQVHPRAKVATKQAHKKV